MSLIVGLWADFRRVEDFHDGSLVELVLERPASTCRMSLIAAPWAGYRTMEDFHDGNSIELVDE